MPDMKQERRMKRKREKKHKAVCEALRKLRMENTRAQDVVLEKTNLTRESFSFNTCSNGWSSIMAS